MVALALRLLAAVTLIGIVASPRPAGATTARALTLEHQLASSTVVIVGRVGSAVTVHDPVTGHWFTDTTVDVERVLHGEHTATLVIRQLGSFDGGVNIGVVGDGRLRSGDRVVLFVRRGPDGRDYLTALAQSVFYVLGTADDAAVQRRLAGLRLLDEAPDGRWAATEPNDPRTLLDLRAAIRRALR